MDPMGVPVACRSREIMPAIRLTHRTLAALETDLDREDFWDDR